MRGAKARTEKFCPACQQKRPVERFSKHRRRGDGLQSLCKTCSSGLNRERFRRDPAYYREYNHEARRRNRARVLEYLSTRPCIDCGEADPVVLEFDHATDDKRCDVSKMISSALSWATILAEIEKCVVRCANCHRRKTARTRGHYRSVTAGAADERSAALRRPAVPEIARELPGKCQKSP